MGEERVRKTNNGGQKKSHLVISSSISNGGGGGNGIAGLLVFGGVLALAGFIALASFTTNKNKAKAKTKTKDPLTKDDNSKSQDHHDHEIETTPNNDGDAIFASASACHGTSNKNINQTLIPEEKIDPNLNANSEVVSPTCFHHQEIVLSDDSNPESAASSNENGIEDECLVSLFDNPSSEAQEVDQDESLESLKSIEIDTKIEDDDDDNVVLESGQEEKSSNVTEGTSLNSKEEAVLPPELIEKLEQDFKEEEGITDIQSEEAKEAVKTHISASADCCDSHACSETIADGSQSVGTDGAMTVTPEGTLNGKTNICVVLNDQPLASRSFQQGNWHMPMLLLALVLVLVLLTHRTHQSFYALDDMK